MSKGSESTLGRSSRLALNEYKLGAHYLQEERFVCPSHRSEFAESPARRRTVARPRIRSEEHTSELQSTLESRMPSSA